MQVNQQTLQRTRNVHCQSTPRAVEMDGHQPSRAAAIENGDVVSTHVNATNNDNDTGAGGCLAET